MESLPELILDTLYDLDDKDFKRFKWHLERPQPAIPGFQPLKKSALQNADMVEVTDKIVQSFPGKETLIMVTILPKVNRRDLVKRFGDTPTGKI